jgi:hypothetical protein
VRVYDWCMNAEVGDRVVYYSSPPGGLSQLPASSASSAQEASRAGYVFLAQRRRPEGGFDYEATRINRATAIRLGLIQERRWREAA